MRLVSAKIHSEAKLLRAEGTHPACSVILLRSPSNCSCKPFCCVAMAGLEACPAKAKGSKLTPQNMLQCFRHQTHFQSVVATDNPLKIQELCKSCQASNPNCPLRPSPSLTSCNISAHTGMLRGHVCLTFLNSRGGASRKGSLAQHLHLQSRLSDIWRGQLHEVHQRWTKKHAKPCRNLKRRKAPRNCDGCIPKSLHPLFTWTAMFDKGSCSPGSC